MTHALIHANFQVQVQVHEGSGPLLLQWEMFSGAVGVVGPHGAGFTNMIVMKPPSVIVEVRICCDS
jgi:capsular polysaccharide biosynthesis protein